MLIQSSSGRPYVVVASNDKALLSIHPTIRPNFGMVVLELYCRYALKGGTSFGEAAWPSAYSKGLWKAGHGSRRTTFFLPTAIPLGKVTKKAFTDCARTVAKAMPGLLVEDGTILPTGDMRSDFQKDFADLLMALSGRFFMPTHTLGHAGTVLTGQEFSDAMGVASKAETPTFEPSSDPSMKNVVVIKFPGAGAEKTPAEPETETEPAT